LIEVFLNKDIPDRKNIIIPVKAIINSAPLIIVVKATAVEAPKPKASKIKA